MGNVLSKGVKRAHGSDDSNHGGKKKCGKDLRVNNSVAEIILISDSDSDSDGEICENSNSEILEICDSDDSDSINQDCEEVQRKVSEVESTNLNLNRIAFNCDPKHA